MPKSHETRMNKQTNEGQLEGDKGQCKAKYNVGQQAPREKMTKKIGLIYTTIQKCDLNLYAIRSRGAVKL